MGKNKTPKGVSSKISSTANPAATSTTENKAQSSILRSSFSPSTLQLSLFASVIQSFDSQHLRVHETTTGRLRCEHTIPARASITCLDWGYYTGFHGERSAEGSKRKRKRTELVNGDIPSSGNGDAAIAFGTSDSKIYLFSPAESKLVRTFEGAHTNGVRDFKFSNHGLHAEAWSIGGDAKAVHWDLKKGKAIRTITLPFGPATALRPRRSSVICASQNAYILDIDPHKKPLVFTASTNPIHSILDSPTNASHVTKFLTAAETDRYINVFSVDSSTLIGSLRTENEVLVLDSRSNSTGTASEAKKVDDVSLNKTRPQELLLAVNKDGAIEVFTEPFEFATETSKEESKSIKARMQKRSRPKDALIRIIRPERNTSIVPLISASFQEDYITMAWVEGGINPVFEKTKWRDETSGNFLLREVTDIVKTKSGPGVGADVINGVKDMGRLHVDESHAVVGNKGDAGDVSMSEEPAEIIEISSGQESDSEDDLPAALTENKKIDAQAEDQDVDMQDVDVSGTADQTPGGGTEQPEQVEEPSFGDLIRASAPDTVDVQASYADPDGRSLVPGGDKSLQQLPSGMSLGTVLTQSLRTNDTNLLETCFHIRDLSMVRATIERLDSSFAGILLQRLAERFHSRPGRAGSLMVWAQWTIVAHGGYLCGRPEILKQVESLRNVIKERASCSSALLRLKGKLDMTVAQHNLRKDAQMRSREANATDDDDGEGVVYVEGQEESDSEEEREEISAAPQSRSLKGVTQSQEAGIDDESDSGISESESDEDEGSEEEMPTTNGAIAESEDEDSDDDEEALLDMEASSTDQDSENEASEDEVDHDSIDSLDTSDADTSPPPKRPANSKLSNGINARKH
ncbi:Small subunit (SSU) processome component [Lecanora helva]